jgi:hypothetical protein
LQPNSSKHAGSSLLCTLNELLTRTAVMVQPLVHLQQLPSSSTDSTPLVAFMDVPLPLCAATAQQQQQQQQQGASGVQTPSAAASATPADPAAAGDPFADLLQMGSSSSDANQRDAEAAAAGRGEELLPVETRTPSRSSSMPQRQQQQQQQQQQHSDGSMTVLAIDRQQPDSAQLQHLRLPGHIVAALQQLQLTSAVGWLRLVRLPAAAAASSSNVSSVALSASKCYA